MASIRTDAGSLKVRCYTGEYAGDKELQKIVSVGRLILFNEDDTDSETKAGKIIALVDALEAVLPESFSVHDIKMSGTVEVMA
jgi:hypothetical protein